MRLTVFFVLSITEPPQETLHHPSSVDMVVVENLLRRAGSKRLQQFLEVRARVPFGSGACMPSALLTKLGPGCNPKKKFSSINKARAAQIVSELGARFSGEMAASELLEVDGLSRKRDSVRGSDSRCLSVLLTRALVATGTGPDSASDTVSQRSQTRYVTECFSAVCAPADSCRQRGVGQRKMS